jgi:hypothetical protein
MKVLKKGSGAKSWSREFKCTGRGNDDGGCGARLLVEKTDLFHTYRSTMGRDEDWFITFKCPECGVLTDIPAPFDAKELPSQSTWERKAKRRV